ncbi:hypothetical protein ACFFRR_005141 [Megaselia abdita]
MGNVFTQKSANQNVFTHISKKKERSCPSKSKTKRGDMQLNDSISDRDHLPFQIFCYQQYIKNGDRTARLFQSKLALTEGIIKTHNSFEDADDSLIDLDDHITKDLQSVQGENKKLNEYRKKLIVHLREIERSKRKKKKDGKKLMNAIGKTARSSVKIIVGKRKHIASMT